MRALALALALAGSAAPPSARAPAPAPPAPPPAQALPRVQAAFEHSFSSATGRVALTWPALAHDAARGETYVVGDGVVRIFGPSGMELHRFGDDGSLGIVERAVPLDDGDIIVLSRIDDRRALLRCNYRGELITRFGLTGLPEAFADFDPDVVVHRGGKLYFAERGTMRVVMTDPDGGYRQSFQLRDLVASAPVGEGDRKVPVNMDGFNVDAAGNLLFTISTMFSAGLVTPAGEVRMFGTRGSTPGRFNVVGGIDADEQGNIYVTDRLRSVVSVWNKDLRHLGDFGYRGDDDANLITPYEIAVGNGHVFVAQAGQRGVKAFRVRFVEPPPPAPPAAEDVPVVRRAPPGKVR